MLSKVLQLVAVCAVLAIVASLPITSDLETKPDNSADGEISSMRDLKNCEKENPDCGYLAFKVYSSYFPEDEFVVAAAKLNADYAAKLAECDKADVGCDNLKAQAFDKLFPDSNNAGAAEEHAVAAPSAEHEALRASMAACIEKDPLCRHLAASAFCAETQNSGKDVCTNLAALDVKFGALAKKCEKKPDGCKKVAKVAFRSFFPDAVPEDELRLCKAENPDCGYLVFKAYAHYNPTSEWVIKVKAENAKMAATVTECNAEDDACNKIKAAAFLTLFPQSKKAAKDAAGPKVSTEEHLKMKAIAGECFEKDPVCKHVVIEAFCGEESAAESQICKKQIKTEKFFAKRLERCETLLSGRCEAIANKAVCDFFPTVCAK